MERERKLRKATRGAGTVTLNSRLGPDCREEHTPTLAYETNINVNKEEVWSFFVFEVEKLGTLPSWLDTPGYRQALVPREHCHG